MRRCCSVQKKCTTKTKYSRNETILKISHLAKAIAFERWSVWVKKSYQKRSKNDFATILELMCGKKNPRKKHQIFKKKKLTTEDTSTRSEVVDDFRVNNIHETISPF